MLGLQYCYNSHVVFHFTIPDRSQYEHSDIVAGYAGDFAAQDFQRPTDMSWNMLRSVF